MADAPQIHFTKAAFQELIQYVGEVESDINSRFLAASGGLQLDDSLGSFLQPGNPSWDPPLGTLKSIANTFGGSVETKFRGLSDDWRTYKENLNDAMKVFDKTDDLASMDAGEFSKQYPDLGVGGGL